MNRGKVGLNKKLKGRQSARGRERESVCGREEREVDVEGGWERERVCVVP